MAPVGATAGTSIRATTAARGATATKRATATGGGAGLRGIGVTATGRRAIGIPIVRIWIMLGAGRGVNLVGAGVSRKPHRFRLDMTLSESLL